MRQDVWASWQDARGGKKKDRENGGKILGSLGGGEGKRALGKHYEDPTGEVPREKGKQVNAIPKTRCLGE